MNNLEQNLQAGTRFISSEMQDLLDRTLVYMPNWKWLGLISGIIAVYFLRILVLNFFRKVKTTQSFLTEKSFMQFFLKLDIERGLSWAFVALVAINLVGTLELPDSLERNIDILLKVIFAGNIIRVCYLAVEAFGSKIHEWAKTTESQIDDQLAPLATKTLKVLVVITGVLVVLQNLGVNVTALLAGLGIGGVALAFAAQDTVANVFGTITILLDAPFKLGDRVKIGDTDGTIEEVGFRSTRIRTLYNSVVSIPNSVVAKEKIDNMTDRNNWIRFRQIVGVTYEANPIQISKFCSELTSHLHKDTTVDPTRIVVNLHEYGESSINILVNFHYKIDLGQVESVCNQHYLETIRMCLLNEGMDFAFPTRTLILQNQNNGIDSRSISGVQNFTNPSN